MADNQKKHRKKHRVNTARFIPFLLIAILLVVGVIFGMDKLMGRDTADGGGASAMSFKEGVAPIKTGLEEKTWKLVLVNPWHSIPEWYKATPKEIPYEWCNENGLSCDERVYDDLVAMLKAAKKAGMDPLVYGAYRKHDEQYQYFVQHIAEYKSAGQSEAEAIKNTALIVAVPGTSEHECGLAFDIVERSYPYHNYEQDKQPTCKWLHEHAWEYGFILRYPKGKTDITGIDYEPWHFRYVGKDAAKDIHEQNVTLEEYLGKAKHGKKVKFEYKK